MSESVLVPIFDSNRGFRIWSKSEIFTGSGTGRYVPNVDDLVHDWVQGQFRVISVDYSTGFSVLQEWIPPAESDAITNSDILLGGGPGPVSDSYRVYVDDSVLPHTLAVDARLRVYGSSNAHIKLFKGSDIGDSGDVISKMYNQSGDLLGENIPLELVKDEEGDNTAIKTPMVGSTTENLENGELVTAVIYNDVGEAVSINRLIVMKTAFVRSSSAFRKFITGIHLESPFVSQSDKTLLEVPINLPIQGLGLMGVVTYSDGGTLRLPVDGTKFNLYGIDAYVASILGQRAPLVLNYKISPDEVTYEVEGEGEVAHISESYFAKTVDVEGSYTVKLYVVPKWVDSITGYRLEFYLHNLDRDRIYNATSYVTVATNSPAFQPKLYGTVQTISFAVNLNDVNGMFANFRHVQTVDVTLLEDGTEPAPNWNIRYTPGADPVYGDPSLQASVELINAEFWRMDISCGAANLDRWLEIVYWPTQPLYDPTSESKAITPDFFNMVFDDKIIEFPISQWNAELQIPVNLDEHDTIILEFFKRTAQTDLFLASSPMPVHQIPQV